MNHVMSSGASYIVAEVDGAGSGGQGEHRKNQVKNKLGQLEVIDQLEAIQYLLEKYGNFIDRDRVGVSGVSYGGYVAGMMLSETSQNHSSLLKCGVAVCPVVDWRYYESAYAERYMGLPLPGDNFQGYLDGSLYRRAKHIKGKRLYLVHGMADANVHLQNSMVFANHLVAYNVPFQQQFYPNEGHFLDGTKRHLFASVLTFLDQCFAKERPAIA